MAKRQSTGKEQNAKLDVILHRYMGNFVGFDITVVTLMTGTIWFSFKKMNLFSALLIFLFIICAFLAVGLAILALVKRCDKIAKWAMILFYVLLVIWGLYVILFLVDTFKIRLLIMEPYATNITGRV